jgi:alkanesulfonate monooxygenase SsuD/methylene tetrahydromethanopterin reductase-like flavin-dependent oxidoreductase (luciferase family)
VSLSDYRHDLQFGVFITPLAAQADDVLELARLADVVGLDIVSFQDHPYQPRFLDTWTLLSVVASVTTNVRVAPNVANLPLRQPVVLARSAASLDILSGGRVELGLGAGAFWDAIAAWGAPRRSPRESVDALEEAIAIIRRVWAGERGIRFEGAHHRLAGAHGGPQPAHDMGIWLGAYGPRMLRIVGRSADGWVPSLPNVALEDVPARQALIDDAARSAGRDPARIRRVANVRGAITDGAVTEWLHGPVEHWVEELVRLVRDLRFDGFVLWSDHEDVLGQTERFAGEVVPAVRAALG